MSQHPRHIDPDYDDDQESTLTMSLQSDRQQTSEHWAKSLSKGVGAALVLFLAAICFSYLIQNPQK